MSMYRPHWMPSVGDPGSYNGHQTQPTPLHPTASHQASTWPTPPPSTRLASSASPPSSYSSSSAANMGSSGGGTTSTPVGNQQLPPTPPKDSQNVQSQDHQLGHSSHHHTQFHQTKHEPSSSHSFSETNSNCLMGPGSNSTFDASLSREDSTGTRLTGEQAIDQQQYNHHQHPHETKDNLLATKSELNPPSSMGPTAPLDNKHQPQSPISHPHSTYDHHPPSSSSSSYNAGGGIGANTEHDGYAANTYSSIHTSSSSAYSPPPLHHPHHQGQHVSHHHHNSSSSSLLGGPGDSGVRGSASSTGGSEYSVNNLSPPISHSGLADSGLSTYSSSGHVGAIRTNSSFNSSSNTSKGSSKGKNRPNAGIYKLE